MQGTKKAAVNVLREIRQDSPSIKKEQDTMKRNREQERTLGNEKLNKRYLIHRLEMKL